MAPLKTQLIFFEDGFVFLKSFFSFAYSVSILKLIFLSELPAFFLMILNLSVDIMLLLHMFLWMTNSSRTGETDRAGNKLSCVSSYLYQYGKLCHKHHMEMVCGHCVCSQGI
jgi:hypothetical protein